MRMKQATIATLFRGQICRHRARSAEAAAVIVMLIALLPAGECAGQGTMTFTFEGLPRGTQLGVGVYFDSGISIGPLGPGNVLLTGGGMPAHPDNGTGYLEIPDGNMGFWFTSGAYFDLLSFDAARYGDLAPPALEVIGYHEMGLRVTNHFNVVSGGSDFQTFHPDSQFLHVYRVDVLNARWSLDNLVIGGIPEPSGVALMLVGAASGLWLRRTRWRRRNRLDSRTRSTTRT